MKKRARPRRAASSSAPSSSTRSATRRRPATTIATHDKQTEDRLPRRGQALPPVARHRRASRCGASAAATVGGHLVEPRHRADRRRRLPIRDDADARRSRQGAAARMHERLVDRPVAVERRVGRTTCLSAPRPDADDRTQHRCTDLEAPDARGPRAPAGARVGAVRARPRRVQRAGGRAAQRRARRVRAGRRTR